jgi:hypothetical protein
MGLFSTFLPALAHPHPIHRIPVPWGAVIPVLVVRPVRGGGRL